MVRGVNRSAIFEDDLDRVQFLDRLGANVIAAHASVYAWVLMTNHVHILFKSGRDGISSVMRKLLTWYAQHYNRSHNRTGHLFENRYKSILCDEDKYLLALIRYIHLNPVRANMVATIEELDGYVWSGHPAIIGNAQYPWMAVDHVLEQFGSNQQDARAEYRSFVHADFHGGAREEFRGGGLVRSQGGWSQVIAMRRKGPTDEADERILGNGDFVHAVLKEAEARHLRQLKHQRSGRTITDIIGEECERAGIGVQELSAGSRRRVVSRTRAVIAYRSSERMNGDVVT
jgi:REP element-mobilizing transposase RayT